MCVWLLIVCNASVALMVSNVSRNCMMSNDGQVIVGNASNVIMVIIVSIVCMANNCE